MLLHFFLPKQITKCYLNGHIFFNKLTEMVENYYLIFDEDAKSKKKLFLADFENSYFQYIMQYLEKPNLENPKMFKEPSIDYKLTF